MREPAEFLQAYVLTMDSGAVYLVRVMASTYERGREIATESARILDRGPVWDDPCGYPVKAEMIASGPGIEAIRGPEKES